MKEKCLSISFLVRKSTVNFLFDLTEANFYIFLYKKRKTHKICLFKMCPQACKRIMKFQTLLQATCTGYSVFRSQPHSLSSFFQTEYFKIKQNCLVIILLISRRC